MVGTKLTMKLDRDGNIKSVSGGESLAGGGASGLEGLLAGLGKGAGGMGGVPLPTSSNAGPMGWVITGPAQKSSVHVGETWTNNDSLSGTPIGGFTMMTKHTCKSASPTSANFSFSGRADAQSSGQGDGGGAGLGGLLGGFALKESSYGGTYTWDTGRGELKEMTSTLNTRIEQGSGGAGGAGSTQLTGETRVNVRRVD
jgi:hypothetical protein